MRITPLDVRKQEFKRTMRGYDGDEVRAFLSNLADEYEAVLVDNKQIRERVMEQDEKLGEYRHLEQTLRDTLMTAERVSQDARETARKEGEVMLQEARQRVERVLAEGREGLADLRREALAAHREKEAYLGRFRSFAEAQIQFVEQHRSDFKELDGRLLDQSDPPYGKEPTPSPAEAMKDRNDFSASMLPKSTERDKWRSYAIEAEDATADDPSDDGEVERIADVLQEAEETVNKTEPVPSAIAEADVPEETHSPS